MIFCLKCWSIEHKCGSAFKAKSITDEQCNQKLRQWLWEYRGWCWHLKQSCKERFEQPNINPSQWTASEQQVLRFNSQGHNKRRLQSSQLKLLENGQCPSETHCCVCSSCKQSWWLKTCSGPHSVNTHTHTHPSLTPDPWQRDLAAINGLETQRSAAPVYLIMCPTDRHSCWMYN